MRVRRSRSAGPASSLRRRGATLVESAVVLGVLLLVLFGMLDLGLAVLHHNTVSEAARRLAREAVVHGELAGAEGEAWGPGSVSMTADADSPIAEAVRPILTVIDPQDVSLSLSWPDAGNAAGQRVSATVSYQHQMMFPFVANGGLLDLQSVSTMRVAH